ncbi:hypothetical protein RP20_CCG014376 [Aedes albopictus]|nr:hypothetical protein RP20_CCG014376 [Aedes albopictus]
MNKEAKASEKYEMGKARAIFGTGVKDYAICAYALDRIEEYLYNIDGVESGLQGFDHLATRVECTMVDYADFNYQHTLQAQSLVFKCLADQLEAADHHPDKVKASRWLQAALLDQHCKFPQDKGRMVRAVQGMFSSIRGTNFINTILNLGYFIQAQEWVAIHLNLRTERHFNIHQGDDVWITNQSRLWAIAFYNVAAATGLLFQPAKRLFDVNLGEFLRMVYVHGACRGYVARAIGALIIKPIQGAEVVSPAERVVALDSQIMHLVRRGYDPDAAVILLDAVVPYAARAKLAQGAITIPVGYLMMSFLDNGLDAGHPYTAAPRVGAVAPIPTMELRCDSLARNMPCEMATDYVDMIGSCLKRPFLRDELIASLHNTNVVGSMRQEDRMFCLRRHERDFRKWLNKLSLPTVTRTRAAYEALRDGSSGSNEFDDLLKWVSSRSVEKVTPIASWRGLLAELERLLGVQGVTELLDGARADAGKYECEYHPVLLSWVQNYALESAQHDGDWANSRERRIKRTSG